jgi:hypothetical protein
MSKSLGTVFDLKEIFEKATDLIFRGTPADRVVALLADETLDGKILDYSLNPVGVRTRDEKSRAITEKLTISRTITQKVMRDKVALLSQDAPPMPSSQVPNRSSRRAYARPFVPR